MKQTGGGKCSLCGAANTNKSTCPINSKAKANPATHPDAFARRQMMLWKRQAKQNVQSPQEQEALRRIAKERQERQTKAIAQAMEKHRRGQDW